jgi:hypothetical protein
VIEFRSLAQSIGAGGMRPKRRVSVLLQVLTVEMALLTLAGIFGVVAYARVLSAFQTLTAEGGATSRCRGRSC